MKISEQEVSRLLSVSPFDRRASASSAAATVGGVSEGRLAARVDISPSAQDIQRVAQVISELPDVREDRVQALKAQIESGTYHVSGEDIADLIIRRALADNTAL